MIKLYTNGEKTIVTTGEINMQGNVWYNSARNGKAFGRQFRMTGERFQNEFWEVIEFEATGETLDEIIARDKAGR